MTDTLKKYWDLRLSEVRNVLQENNFEVFLANDRDDAKNIVLKKILPNLKPKSISWGGSVTFADTGLYQELSNNPSYDILDTYDQSLSKEEKLKKRREALLTDLFITGTNALTDTGKLINLDMIGNRVGAITFGPKNVIIMVGRNKLIADVDQAILRIKNLAAPANALRLGMKTPCAKTGYCEECQSKDRICNSWTIHEKSFPKGRIKVVLINEDMGL